MIAVLISKKKLQVVPRRRRRNHRTHCVLLSPQQTEVVIKSRQIQKGAPLSSMKFKEKVRTRHGVLRQNRDHHSSLGRRGQLCHFIRGRQIHTEAFQAMESYKNGRIVQVILDRIRISAINISGLGRLFYNLI